MSTALTQYQPNQTNLVNLESPSTIETIKNSICKGATNEQLQTFLTLAKCFNLNPFAKEIYFSNQIGVFIGRHGKLRIANRHPDFRGLNSYAIRENDEFETDFVSGKITKHTSGKNAGKIIGAWAIGKRNGFDDVVEVCWLDEFKKNNPAWQGYTQDMIKYKAEDRVLRTLFNSEYEGINTVDPEEEIKEEMKLSFEEKHSPAVLEASDAILQEFENSTAPTVNQKQIARLFARAGELQLSNNQVKEFLVENKFITFCPEKGDFSTSTLKQKDYETAYSKLDELSEQVNQTRKQTTLFNDLPKTGTEHL